MSDGKVEEKRSGQFLLPELVESFVDVREKNGYRRIFNFSAQPGTVLVQEVQTRVRYRRGEDQFVDYWSRYGEFFSMGERRELAADNDQHLDMRDVHDFDLRRDGWSLSGLNQLLKRQGSKSRGRLPSADATITCEKRFLIAIGEVKGTVVLKENGGQSFGFLLEGPCAPASVQIELPGSEEEGRRTLTPKSPFPFGYSGAGSGKFCADSAYELTERFVFSFATDSLRFDDGGGYREVPMSEALAGGL